MKTTNPALPRLLVIWALVLAVNCFAQLPPFPPDDGGGSGGTNSTPPLLNTNRNHIKFMGQTFVLLDTNIVAQTDTNLYTALLAFADDANTIPVLQVAPYGADTLLIKASHFDYSAESARDFALLIGDKLETPVWKSIDLSGASDSQDGWLVQGTVPRWLVTDPMFLQVSNIARDCNAFFRVIPYGGPEITISGPQPYDVVSNTIALQLAINDLSGVTNEQLDLNVDGVPVRFSLGSSNTLNLETKYNVNGLNNLYVNAFNDNARVYNPTNPPDNAKLYFAGTSTIPLDFENDTYLAFASDMCPLDVGTNNILFVIDKAQDIEATISDPSDGHVVASYSGNVPYPATVAIPWDFTESDGVTPYSNDTYVVTFTAFDPTTLTITNKIDKGGNLRPPGGCLLTYQWEDPSDPTGAYLNNKADQVIGGDLLTLYQDIYKPYSLTQYGVGVVGSNRDHAVCAPYDSYTPGWTPILSRLTNAAYFSELTIAQAHGSGAKLGGGYFLPDTIDPHDLELWVKGPTASHNWRLRKANMFTCYSGSILLTTAGVQYPTWAEACGIRPAGQQEVSYMYKNCGLFFADLLPQAFNDAVLGGTKVTAEVAEFVDQAWVCGKYQYPGGCDPTYSFDFAIQAAIGRYPDLVKAAPSRGGFGKCVYSCLYDEELRNLDTSHVKIN